MQLEEACKEPFINVVVTNAAAPGASMVIMPYVEPSLPYRNVRMVVQSADGRIALRWFGDVSPQLGGWNLEWHRLAAHLGLNPNAWVRYEVQDERQSERQPSSEP